LSHRTIDFGNGIDDRQGGQRFKFIDAEMSDDRRDGSGVCACGGQTLNQPHEDCGLFSFIAGCEILGQIAQFGVYDCQFQRLARAFVPLNQASIVVFGRGGTDPAD
jgi:hypothetical protein